VQLEELMGAMPAAWEGQRQILAVEQGVSAYSMSDRTAFVPDW
jgi:hypothetical protein